MNEMATNCDDEGWQGWFPKLVHPTVLENSYLQYGQDLDTVLKL